MTGMQKQRQKGFQQTEVDGGERGHGWVYSCHTITVVFVGSLHKLSCVVDVVKQFLAIFQTHWLSEN